MNLLDVNVLIALGDPNHLHHVRCRKWFETASQDGWATCPLTENGFIRILGHSRYPGFSGGTNESREFLQVLTQAPGHQFWPDDVSILNTENIPHLSASKHLTDIYLLYLATNHGGQLVTLDENIQPNLVINGKSTYLLIPPVS